MLDAVGGVVVAVVGAADTEVGNFADVHVDVVDVAVVDVAVVEVAVVGVAVVDVAVVQQLHCSAVFLFRRLVEGTHDVTVDYYCRDHRT